MKKLEILLWMFCSSANLHGVIHSNHWIFYLGFIASVMSLINACIEDKK